MVEGTATTCQHKCLLEPSLGSGSAAFPNSPANFVARWWAMALHRKKRVISWYNKFT